MNLFLIIISLLHLTVQTTSQPTAGVSVANTPTEAITETIETTKESETVADATEQPERVETTTVEEVTKISKEPPTTEQQTSPEEITTSATENTTHVEVTETTTCTDHLKHGTHPTKATGKNIALQTTASALIVAICCFLSIKAFM